MIYFLLVFMLLSRDFSRAAVASNMRFNPSNMWMNGRLVLAPASLESQFFQQPQQQQQAEQFSTANMLPTQAASHGGQYPQGALFTSNQQPQAAMLLASDGSQSFGQPNMMTGGVDNSEVVSAQSMQMGNPSNFNMILGGPGGAIIGADGSVVGSTQDTAAVDSAGQSSPILLQAPTNAQQQPQPQQVSFTGMANPYHMLMSPNTQPNVVQIAVDQYGQPVYQQIPSLAMYPGLN